MSEEQLNQIRSFITTPVWYDRNGAQIFCKRKMLGGESVKHIADIEVINVRGWGQLSGMMEYEKAVEMTDLIGQFFADIINEKLFGNESSSQTQTQQG